MNAQILNRQRLLRGALLVLSSAFQVLGQASNSLTVRGSIGGFGIGELQGTTVQGAMSGSGNASQIGQFSYVLPSTIDLVSGAAKGTFLLSSSNGDVLSGTQTSKGAPTETPNVMHLVVMVTISGGTGRFEGASGTLTLDILDDQSTLPIYTSHSGTLTGTISTKK